MDADETDNGSSTETVEFLAEGDILLVVGEDKMRVPAHSFFLGTASEPFHAMLGPYSSKGQNDSRDPKRSSYQMTMPTP